MKIGAQDLKIRVLFVVLVWGLLPSCNRKQDDSVAKLKLSFPTNEQAKTMSKESSSKPTFDSGNTPATYADIDCFGVVIGGPEDGMRNSYCQKGSDLSSRFYFGMFAGTYAKGEAITLDVPSGMDRFIKVWGMKKSSSTATCPKVGAAGTDDALNGFSFPYNLGEVGNIKMASGETVDVVVPITATVVSGSYFDDCQGPAMNFSGNGGGGGGGTTTGGPYLRLEGLMNWGRYENNTHITYKPLTIQQCIPVFFKTYSGSGVSYNVTNNLNIPLPATSDVVFVQSPSCTGTPETAVTISVGNNQNNNALYMKIVNANLTSYTFDFPLNSTEVHYSGDGAFAVGKPKMNFSLPTTVGPNLCYPIRAQSFEADGITLLPISQAVNISNSLTFSGRTDLHTCATGISLGTFSGSGESAQMYFQSPASGSGSFTVNNPAPILGLYDILPNNFNVDTAAGMVVTDIAITSLTASISIGQCAPISVAFINKPGVLAPSPGNFTLRIDFSNPTVAETYADSACSTPLSPGLNFATGDYSKTFFIKARGASAGTQIIVSGGPKTLKKASSSISFTSAASTTPFLYLTGLPNWKGVKYIGSHEFTGSGGTYPLSLAFPSGYTITCEKWPGPTDCSANVSGNIFNWPFTEAAAGNTYNFKATSTSGPNLWYTFNPLAVFGNIMFKTCDVVRSGTSLTETALTGGTVICLQNGAGITISATTNLNGLSIIGHSNLSAVLDTGTGSYFDISSPATATLIANVTVQNPNSSAPTIFSIAGSTGPAEFSNVKVNMTSTTTAKAFKIFGGTMTVDLNRIDVNVASGTATGGIIYLDNASGVNIDGLKISNAVNDNLYGIDLFGLSGSLTRINGLKNFDFSGLSRAISLYSTYTNGAQITLADQIHIVSSSNSSPGIQFDANSSMVLKNAYIEKTASSPAITFNGSTTSLDFQGGVIVQNVDYYGMTMAGGTLSEFLDISFVKMGASSPGYFGIIASTAPTINSSNPNSILYCSGGSTYDWASGNKVSGTFSGTYYGNSSQASNFSTGAVQNNRCSKEN